MGEYAIRKSDGKEVKIGTCEDMMYCRYDQLGDIDYPYSCKNMLWRIPTPDEDGTQVGDYESSLMLKNGYIPYHLMIDSLKFDDEDKQLLIKNSGITQVLVDKLGLLCNIKCFHGLKLPDNSDDVKYFWNGKRDPLHLAYLVNKDKELRVGIKCNACGESFSMPFNEAEPLIKSMWMKLRLLHQCSDYWYKHNDESCPYEVKNVTKDNKIVDISSTEYGRWNVSIGDEVIIIGTWEQCRNVFISYLENERALQYRYDVIKKQQL